MPHTNHAVKPRSTTCLKNLLFKFQYQVENALTQSLSINTLLCPYVMVKASHSIALNVWPKYINMVTRNSNNESKWLENYKDLIHHLKIIYK